MKIIIWKLFVIGILFFLVGCTSQPIVPEKCKDDCSQLNTDYGDGSNLNINETKEIMICSCDPWNWRGINVKENEKYKFKVISIVENWVDSTIKSDPDTGWLTWHRYIGSLFWFYRRYPSEPWYVLMGTIGKDEKETFKIGSETSYTIKTEGRLFIYANDANCKYGNNLGKLVLSITKIK